MSNLRRDSNIQHPFWSTHRIQDFVSDPEISTSRPIRFKFCSTAKVQCTSAVSKYGSSKRRGFQRHEHSDSGTTNIPRLRFSKHYWFSLFLSLYIISSENFLLWKTFTENFRDNFNDVQSPSTKFVLDSEYANPTDLNERSFLCKKSSVRIFAALCAWSNDDEVVVFRKKWIALKLKQYSHATTINNY